MQVEESPVSVVVCLRVSERRAIEEGAVHAPAVRHEEAMHGTYFGGVDEDVDIRACAAPALNARLDGLALDVQQADADAASDHLDGGTAELQAHTEGDA